MIRIVLKRLGIGLITLVMFVALVGCSSGSTGLNLTQPPGNNDQSTKNLQLNGSVSYGYDAVGEANPPANETTKAKPNAVQITRKIIKNGEMTIVTADVSKTYAAILAFAKKYDGYEFKLTQTKDGDQFKIKAVIKIKPEMLDALMNMSGKEGEVLVRNTTSKDITADYSDIKIRLKTKEATLTKYYEFLAKAKNVSQTLEIQDYINSITEEIEAAKGQLKMWDTLVDEATLTLTLQQKKEVVVVKKVIKWDALSFEDMGGLISDGFIRIVNGIVSILQWLIIIIAGLSPILVIAAIVLFLFLRNRRKRMNIRSNSKEEIVEEQ